MSDDIHFMAKALELAGKGLGRTGTNPVVGAVLVKNGRIIGSGYHKKMGGPHAEVEALRGLSRSSVKGSSLYVTLEPCAHEKKRTPPCAQFLAASGIKKVYTAMRDPNPLTRGRGHKILEKAGIKVKCGIMEEEASRLNEYYMKSIRTSLPFVTLKLASSLDGRIALSNGSSRWITGLEARRHVHRLRDRHSAVMTTSTTVLADDPHLGVRLCKGRDPLRIIIDRKGKLGRNHKVFRDGNFLLVRGKNDLRETLKELYKEGIGSILVEAGGHFSASLLKDRLVDKCMFFIAPKIIGADGIPSIGDLGLKRLGSVIKIRDASHEIFGDDILISGFPGKIA